MKKIFVMVVACMIAGTAMAEGTAEFKKGEFIGNLGIGVGVNAGNGVSGATFTQKAGFEYALHNFSEKMTLGIGFTAANSYGGRRNTKVAGVYDYEYTIHTQSHVRDYTVFRRVVYNDKNYNTIKRRQGVGMADATFSADDIKLMPTISFHYQVMPSLDLYATIGAGVAIMNGILSNMHNYVGFKSDSDNGRRKSLGGDSWISDTYSYDDKDHATFEGGYTKVGGAFAVNVGARYFFSKHWAAFSEFGITAVSIKSDYPKSWDLFNVGATYKF